MTHEERQRAYAAKRAAHTGYKPPPGVVTRQVRHVGGVTLQQPLTITYHVSNEAETLGMLRAAGLVFVDEPEPPGAFW